MRKVFLINLLFLVALNLLIKPFWFFGIEVAVQNRVSNAEYGIYFSLFSFTNIFNILLDLGINNFNNREIAKNNILLGKFFSNILGIKILLGFIYLAVCSIIGIIIGYSWRYFEIILLLVLNQFLSSFILYLRSNINGLMLFIRDSIISVMDKLIMIVFCSFLLWNTGIFGAFRIEWFICAQTVSYIITALVAWNILIRKTPYFSFRFDIRYLVHIVKRSLPFTILALFMQLYSRMEPVLLERLLPDGKVQAGLYAQAYRMIDVFLNFMLLFTTLLLPLFSNLISKKEDVNPLINLCSRMMYIPAILLVVTCVLYANNLISMMYHTDTSAAILKIIIMGFIGFSSTYIFGTLLTANNNFKQLNLMAAASIVLNISLNLILIPKFKAVGAAWASFSTQSFSGLVQIFIAYKIFKLKFRSLDIYTFLFWIAILLTFGIILKSFVPWKAGVGITIVSGIGMAMLLGLFNIKEMYAIIVEGSEAKSKGLDVND